MRYELQQKRNHAYDLSPVLRPVQLLPAAFPKPGRGQVSTPLLQCKVFDPLFAGVVYQLSSHYLNQLATFFTPSTRQ